MFALLHSLAMFVIDFFKLPRLLEAENLRSRRRICSARWTRSRTSFAAIRCTSRAMTGTGTPGHLVGETFRLSLGLDLVHVPFNSAGLAVGSAVGGHTQICFASPSPAAQQVIEGRLRGLAVTSKTGSQALPNLPTTTELGDPVAP